MANDEVELWSVKRSALYGIGAGIIWHLAVAPSGSEFTNDPVSALIITSLTGCVLFAAAARARNKTALAAAAGLEENRPMPEPICADQDGEEDAGASISPPTAEEQEIRKAAQAFEKGQNERSAAYKAQQDSLRDAKALAERADKFARNSHLDIAVPYLFEEIKHWPSWSKRDDADKWIPALGQTEIGDGGDGGDSFNDQRISWRRGDLSFTIGFKRHVTFIHDSSDDGQYADISVSVDGEQVFKFMAKRNAFSEFARWEYCVVDSLNVGPWVSQLVEFYSALCTYNEQKMADLDAAYHLKKASRINLGDSTSEA